MEQAAEGVLPPSLPAGVLPAGAAAKRVLFPSEDESTGTVSMAWRGPPYAAHGTWLMLRLLWKYLTDSAASPWAVMLPSTSRRVHRPAFG